nr:acyltransferase [Herbaspirillum sp. ASV7]
MADHAQSVGARSVEHVDYLDGWRGLAILFLLIGHFFPLPGLSLARFGVNLFFVLSGLLMGRLLFIKETPLPLFYRRRISRIFPALYTLILLTLVVRWWTAGPIEWNETVLAALFLNNYFSAHPGHAVMPFGHTWSLAVEEQSYVLLSLVALCVRQRWCRALPAMALLVAACVLASFWYWHACTSAQLEFEFSYHTETAGYGLFLSVLLGLWLQHRAIPRLPGWCYPALLLLALMLNWWSVPFPATVVLGNGALALLLNLLPQAPQLFRRCLSWAPLRQLGLWSFSLYLWQQPLYLEHYWNGLSAWIALPLSVLAGIVSYYLVEKPVRQALNQHWGRKMAGGPEKAATR